jgi:hypothetical protein
VTRAANWALTMLQFFSRGFPLTLQTHLREPQGLVRGVEVAATRLEPVRYHSLRW